MAEILRAGRLAAMTGPVIDDGAVAVDAGRIVAAGPFAEVRRGCAGPVRDLGGVTLAPAVFNSHVHLEMTHLLGKTEQGQGFVPWVKSLLAQPLYTPEPAAIRAELFRLERKGCCFVADISTQNAPQMAEILAASGLFFASFREAIGGSVPGDPATLLHPEEASRAAAESGRGVCAAAGHALYSTSPALLRAAKAACSGRGLPYSLHLAEHQDEDAILLTGANAFLDLMRERGFMNGFVAPGQRPVPFAASLGLLDAATLCVHCVTVSAADIALIARSGATVCLCPRSNKFIGVGRAPLEKFLAAGVNVCLGTDGLCSNSDLDPFGELEFLGRRDAGLDLCDALRLITVNPARFFGLADRLGRLAPGCEARFSIVPEPVLEMFATS
jgi:cytosine/adenosine deaminase-related metal-dependent hydrolase